MPSEGTFTTGGNLSIKAGRRRRDRARRRARMRSASKSRSRTVVTKLGGSISAEHGIGIAEREWLPQAKDKVALELMRSLKQTLDPNGILNPGKVL